jgi:hypothetical protein
MNRAQRAVCPAERIGATLTATALLSGALAALATGVAAQATLVPGDRIRVELRDGRPAMEGVFAAATADSVWVGGVFAGTAAQVQVPRHAVRRVTVQRGTRRATEKGAFWGAGASGLLVLALTADGILREEAPGIGASAVLQGALFGAVIGALIRSPVWEPARLPEAPVAASEPAGAVAALPATPHPGERIRIHLLHLDREVDGRLVRATADSVVIEYVLWGAGPQQAALARAHVGEVYAYRGRAASGASFARFGFLAGSAVGVTMGLLFPDADLPATTAYLSGVLVGSMGASAGWLLGTVLAMERWEPVEVAIASRPDGGLALAVTLPW